MNEQEFRELKEQVEEARTAADRAQGTLNALLSRLKQEFDCKDLKQAKAMLEDLSQRRQKAEADFEKALSEYERKWKQ